jgi:hypothetical protein
MPTELLQDNKRFWGTIRQGKNETIAYTVKFGKWGTTIGATPTNYTYDHNGTDTSSTNLSGSTSTSGTDVITKSVTALVSGETYRFVIRAIVDGNTMEAWGYVIGED